jgi:hypothetical protein
MTFGKLAYIMCIRIGVVVIIGGMFLPPDAQNPHAIVDAILLIFVAILWTVSDYLFLEEE